ncbi:MAG: propionyl-CoA--succinate CoA transferase [Microthrixaceae bacterium]|nr:propionyl-CoA--succinate CoA transferase [Microthrixaceae bacterium]
MTMPTPSDAEAVLDLLSPGTNVVVPLANGEPVSVLNAIDSAADRLVGIRVHQMHALHDHPYLHHTDRGRLDHVSYFLSDTTREPFRRGTVDLVPTHFSEMPLLLRQLEGPLVVTASVSPPDHHGYFTLGTNADYAASLIGTVPFFVEVNARMPRTNGRNQIHVSQVAGWCEADYPLVEVPVPDPTDVERHIGELVAERIDNRSTIQAGIGAVPTAVLEFLGGHTDLGIHTEVMSDPMIDLIESGVVTGVHKVRVASKAVATFALGTRRLYDFLDEHLAVELLPVDWVNDPRVIAQQPRMVSINATTEVDFLGQCASETVAGRYWSGSGGQADFARGAMYSEGGQGFVVLPSTARGGTVSRIVGQLTPGSAVTTMKNTVDKVVTEHGVAELRGRSIRERTHALIAIAAPEFRDDLVRDAIALGYW